jgi:hypothetical protein
MKKYIIRSRGFLHDKYKTYYENPEEISFQKNYQDIDFYDKMQVVGFLLCLTIIGIFIGVPFIIWADWKVKKELPKLLKKEIKEGVWQNAT